MLKQQKSQRSVKLSKFDRAWALEAFKADSFHFGEYNSRIGSLTSKTPESKSPSELKTLASA